MKITTAEVTEVNRRFGGSPISDSSLSFAEAACRDIRSSYRRAAMWARAILVDHPFSDANKRTAVYAIGSCITIRDQQRVVRAVLRIASRNITDLKKIEEVLKNANK